MEKTNLHDSEKNIPTASNNKYKVQLINKIEAVIKRMRWKALFLDNTAHNDGTENKEKK